MYSWSAEMRLLKLLSKLVESASLAEYKEAVHGKFLVLALEWGGRFGRGRGPDGRSFQGCKGGDANCQRRSRC